MIRSISLLFCLSAITLLAQAERIKIDTPELFEKLRAGGFAVSQSDVFLITPGAHENVLSQPKHFAASKYHLLSFRAEDQGSLSIQPHQKSVAASFINGTQTTLGMPGDYKEYKFGIAKTVKVDKAAIEYIFQWTNAKTLGIYGENVVAFELQKRLNKLKALSNLEEVHFDIAYGNYMKLRMKSFADTLTSLKKANFYGRRLSAGRFAMFVKSQTIPTGWKCVVEKNSEYNCTKN